MGRTKMSISPSGYKTMSFLPQLKLYLKSNGVIYTVRRFKESDAVVDVIDVGLCHRIPMGTIDNSEDLKPYVDNSGFSTVKDWWEKIKYFIPSYNDTMYLYKVEVLQ